MPIAKVHRIPAAAPDDLSGIEQAIAQGRIAPEGVRAIFGKTEGNGCVNDFSRGFASHVLRGMLKRHIGSRADNVCLVMSGGTEGGLAPHWLVLERCEGSTSPGKPALAIGTARTADLPPEALGRRAQVELVAEGVRHAMRDAEIDDPADIHFVQVKCPLLTLARVREAAERSADTATRDTLKSMGLSRGASALGVAVALGEIEPEVIAEAEIGADASLWSARASASAGIELMGHEIVVLGMSRAWSGDLAIAHAVMRDAIDVEPVRVALARLGLPSEGQLPTRYASGSLRCWPRPSRRATASCAAIATLCSTTATSAAPDTPGPSSRRPRGGDRACRAVRLRRGGASGTGWRRPSSRDRAAPVLSFETASRAAAQPRRAGTDPSPAATTPAQAI